MNKVLEAACEIGARDPSSHSKARSLGSARTLDPREDEQIKPASREESPDASPRPRGAPRFLSCPPGRSAGEVVGRYGSSGAGAARADFVAKQRKIVASSLESALDIKATP